MASLYRLAAGATLNTIPSKIAFACFSRSAILSSATLSNAQSGSPHVSEIFDIFDAPVRLRERTISDERLAELNTSSATRLPLRSGPSHSQSIYDDALGLPWSLPPPVTFDGPACPPHMSSSTLARRRLRRQNSIYSLRGDPGLSVVSCSTFVSKSDPLYRVFDGPSRVVPYPYPTSRDEGYLIACASLALCLSSAFGWLVYKDSMDLPQSVVRTP